MSDMNPDEQKAFVETFFCIKHGPQLCRDCGGQTDYTTHGRCRECNRRWAIEMGFEEDENDQRL